jgi:hypothetical protein
MDQAFDPSPPDRSLNPLCLTAGHTHPLSPASLKEHRIASPKMLHEARLKKDRCLMIDVIQFPERERSPPPFQKKLFTRIFPLDKYFFLSN